MTIGVLCIHGFSGGPYEVEPFATYLAANTRWIIDMPTLSGHGDELYLKGSKHSDWLMDAELAYRRMAKRVDEIIIVGFSMGGLIAMYLAKRYPVKKLVLLSAAAKYVSAKQLLKDFRVIANDARHGKLRNNELFKRYQYKLTHVPVSATVEFTKVVRKVAPYIAHLKMPVFIVQGNLDGIVPVSSARFLYNEISSEEKYIYFSENGKHHICYSDDSENWFQQVLSFLRAVQ